MLDTGFEHTCFKHRTVYCSKPIFTWHLPLYNIATISLQEFAETLKIPFLETSAKNASNVEKAFLTMASEIQKRVVEDNVQNETVKVGKINSAPLWHGAQKATAEEVHTCC